MSDVMIRGPIIGGSGTPSPFTSGLMGGQRVSDAHGRYFDSVYGLGGARVYHAATQAAVTFGVGLSTTAVFSLTNPLGSGKYLALLDVAFAFSAAPAAAAVVYLVGQPYSVTAVTHTTPISVRANRWTGAAQTPAGLADSSSTLAATPVVILPLISVTGASGLTPALVSKDLGGLILVEPGTAIALQASAAAAGFCAISWEEVPILT